MPGAAMSTCRSAELDQGVVQSRRARRRARGRGHAGRAAGRWRSGRCGTGRRAACRRARRAARGARARARSCTSSSESIAAEVPAATAVRELVAARRASAPARRRRAGRRGAAPGRAPGTRPGRRARAASRSGWTRDSRASASDGPPPNRPPQSRVWALAAASGHSQCSSPPRSALAVRGTRRACAVGQRRREPLGERPGPPVGLTGDHQDGVVAGDGAEDVGRPTGPARRPGTAPAPGRRAQHDEVAAGVGAGEQLAQQPGQPGRRGLRRAQRRVLRRQHVGRRAAVRTAQLDRAELLQVARQRRLGDLDARSASSSASSVCERTGRRLDQLDDPGVPGRLGCRAAVTARSSSQTQQRLLRVQPVLRLVPDDALRPVDDLGGDLLAAVGRQAVQHDRRRRPARPSAAASTA